MFQNVCPQALAYLRLVVRIVVNIIRKPPKIIAIANPAVIKSSVLLSIFTKQTVNSYQLSVISEPALQEGFQRQIPSEGDPPTVLAPP